MLSYERDLGVAHQLLHLLSRERRAQVQKEGELPEKELARAQLRRE